MDLERVSTNCDFPDEINVMDVVLSQNNAPELPHF